MSTVRVLVLSLTLAALGAVLAGCTEPPPPPAPDPLITCTSVSAEVSYTPPVQGPGTDVVVTALPGAAVSGCTDHTGSGVTGAALTASVQLPGSGCAMPPIGTAVGGGTGRFDWSSGAGSDFDVDVLTFNNGFALEVTITSGKWAGARASFPMSITALDGACTPASPLTRATLSSRGPLMLHPDQPPVGASMTGIVEIGAGVSRHSCAVTTWATVRCWGSNSDGQLGNLLLGPGSWSDLPLEVSLLGGVRSVATGSRHSCAATTAGAVWCWGANGYGQLGVDGVAASSVPLPVVGVTGVEEVAAGADHTCARRADGAVLCWGANYGGQLGDGTTVGRSSPGTIPGIDDAVSVTAGSSHSCVARAGDLVLCWGANYGGQLGDGTIVDRHEPVEVSVAAVQVSAGSEHTCAVTPDSAVVCWGFNRFGQVGSPPASDNPVVWPNLVSYLTATEVSAGGAHTCARTPAGVVVCWGGNAFGELGDGTTVQRTWALPVFGIRSSRSVHAAGSHTCSLSDDGAVSCWGQDGAGQLGDGRNRASSSLPVEAIAGP